MGRGQPTSRTPVYTTELEILLQKKNNRIAELEAENERIVRESKQCHTTNDELVSERMQLKAKLKRVERVIVDLDTQCTNSHIVMTLQEAIK